MSDASDSSAEHSPADGPLPLQAEGLIGGVALMLMLTVVQRGIGFVRNVFVCRLLEPEQLGFWNLSHTFLILVAPLIVMGIPRSFVRYLEHFRQRGRLHAFLRGSLVLIFVLTLLGLLFLLANRQSAAFIMFGDPNAVMLVTTCVLTLVFVIGFNVGIEILTALRQVKLVAYLQFANGLLFTVLALTLVGVIRLEAQGVLMGYAIACLLTSLIAGILVYRRFRLLPADSAPRAAGGLWSKTLCFAFWFWLCDLTMNLFFVVDRFMVLHFSGESPRESLSMIGQYHASQMIGILMIALTGMLGSVFLSYVSRDWESGRRDLVRKNVDFTLKTVGLSLSAIAAAVLLLAPALFSRALESRYDEGFAVLPMTLAYCIWFGLIPLATNYLWCREKAWLASGAILIGLTTNIVLNGLWLPVWGLAGAVSATAVGNLVSLSLVYVLSYWLGLKFSVGTLVVTGLPAALCLGVLPASAIMLAVVGMGWSGGWLFDRQERERLQQMIKLGWARLRYEKSAALPR